MTGRRDLSAKQKIAEATEMLTTSVADVATDWIYYLSATSYIGGSNIHRYEWPLFGCAVASSFMLAVLFISVLLNFCGRLSNKNFKRVLALEVLIGDIPQLVITALIELEISGGGISQLALITIGTSAYNVFLDAIQYFRLDGDEQPFLKKWPTERSNETANDIEEDVDEFV
eukprot:CAMPEP_0178938232 /NCGR_PEP_ID=MMETSP0786-20121207/26215_1 /TAXON_ID=186022 /ORGANISM="Thalassionema frauenfeldii, Strain CCMP 1798" /LENGTH=171 /DNA_ID=CAMNT_0020616925 /DNA_START=26 /DNA_END=541 /DNA_ORIENTATION=-